MLEKFCTSLGEHNFSSDVRLCHRQLYFIRAKATQFKNIFEYFNTCMHNWPEFIEISQPSCSRVTSAGSSMHAPPRSMECEAQSLDQTARNKKFKRYATMASVFSLGVVLGMTDLHDPSMTMRNMGRKLSLDV